MKNLFLLLSASMALGSMAQPSSAGAATEGPILSPRIHAIVTRANNLIVTVAVPAGTIRVVLESTEDPASGQWKPRASQWLNGQTRDVRFTIPTGGPLEFLRVRSDDATSLPLPYRFYQGPTSFPPQAISDLQHWQPLVGIQPVFGVGAANRVEALALGQNLQVNAGPVPNRPVVESDIWRVDGRMVYAFNSRQGLQVIDLTDVDAPVLRGTLKVPGTGDQLYLLPHSSGESDRALALLTHDGCQSFFDDSGATVVQIVHVRNGAPQAGPKVAVPGQLLESRLVGDVLYLVTDAWILVPQRIEGGVVVAGSWHREARIASIQLARPNAPRVGASLVVAGTANAVHATDRRLYVAMSELNAAELRSPTPGMHGIKVFNISDASGAVRPAGCIPTAGLVADKFKLHENGDLLSVVSLEDNSFRSTLETWSLARPREPRALARLPIVTGENLFATRFDGSRLYVVTFRRMDPLWIIDLTDPAHPSIRGELQVPGWSTYLHPMGDRLLAMGLETGRPTISLFDVAEASAPRLVSKVALVDRWGSSEANETEKAFTVLADQGLVLVPVEGAHGTNDLRVRGTQLVDFDRGGLTLRGLIDHRSGALRAATVDSHLISLSDSELLTVDATDRDMPVVRGRVALRHVVDRVWVVGPHLLQAERGESTGDTNGELRVSTQRAPWSTLTRVPLLAAPLVGESVHQGRLYVVQGTSQTTQRDPGGTEVITNRARLTLTVFDVTRLPALPLIAQSMFEPPDYFGGALTALWPNDHTLVWRSSGLISTVIPLFNRAWPMASPPIVGAIPLPGGQVEEAAALPPQAQLVFPWFPWWVPPPPRLFAVDLNGSTPQFVSDLTLPGANQASYGAMFAADGLLFAGRHITVPEELPPLVFTPTNGGPVLWPIPRARQHGEVVPLDYRHAAQPIVRSAVQVPGQLSGIARQGALWFAVGPHALDSSNVTTHLHALAYDGSVASLVDSLPQENITTGSALISETGSVLAGESGSGGRPPQLVRWELDSDARFRRRAEIPLKQPAVGLARFNDLLTIVTTTAIELRDANQPNQYRLLNRVPIDCNVGANLATADGSQAAGLWLSQGAAGLDQVPVPARGRSKVSTETSR